MARSSTIRVMISSRCNDSFPAEGTDARPFSLLALAGGSAGWAEGGDIGICHTELMTELAQAAGIATAVEAG